MYFSCRASLSSLTHFCGKVCEFPPTWASMALPACLVSGPKLGSNNSVVHWCRTANLCIPWSFGFLFSSPEMWIWENTCLKKYKQYTKIPRTTSSPTSSMMASPLRAPTGSMCFIMWVVKMAVVPLAFQWAALFSLSSLDLDFGALQVIELSVVSFRQWFSILAAHWTHLGRF